MSPERSPAPTTTAPKPLTREAEALARTITNPDEQARSLAAVARAIAGIDPDRAEQIAHTITDSHWKQQLLIDVAGADSDRRTDRPHDHLPVRAGTGAALLQALPTADPETVSELVVALPELATTDAARAEALAALLQALPIADPWKISELVARCPSWPPAMPPGPRPSPRCSRRP